MMAATSSVKLSLATYAVVAHSYKAMSAVRYAEMDWTLVKANVTMETQRTTTGAQVLVTLSQAGTAQEVTALMQTCA